MPPPHHHWLLFAAGALSYGVACLWSSSPRGRVDEDVDAVQKEERQRQRRRRRRRAAAKAAVAAAAAAVAAMDQQQQQPDNNNSTTYRPLRERVSACQARWVLEELEAAAAEEEDERPEAGRDAEDDDHHHQGRHAARVMDMLAAGYGSGLGGEDAARWARVAWALQTGRRPVEADFVGVGGVARRRRPANAGKSDDDGTDDLLSSSGSDDHHTPNTSLFLHV